MDWRELVNLIVAFVLAGPVVMVVVQFIKNCAWSQGVKGALAVLVSAAVGIAQVWVTGDLLGLIDSWGELQAIHVVATAGVAYASATFFFQTYFKGTSAAEWLEKSLYARRE